MSATTTTTASEPHVIPTQAFKNLEKRSNWMEVKCQPTSGINHIPSMLHTGSHVDRLTVYLKGACYALKSKVSQAMIRGPTVIESSELDHVRLYGSTYTWLSNVHDCVIAGYPLAILSSNDTLEACRMAGYNVVSGSRLFGVDIADQAIILNTKIASKYKYTKEGHLIPLQVSGLTILDGVRVLYKDPTTMFHNTIRCPKGNFTLVTCSESGEAEANKTVYSYLDDLPPPTGVGRKEWSLLLNEFRNHEWRRWQAGDDDLVPPPSDPTVFVWPNTENPVVSCYPLQKASILRSIREALSSAKTLTSPAPTVTKAEEQNYTD